MLMIVPLTIWSARTLIESQAWMADTTIAAITAATTPRARAGVIPNTAVDDSAGGPMAAATTQPTKAAVSIIPSMAMFTTPDRSFMVPHSAPMAIGTAPARMNGEVGGMIAIR